MQRFTTITDLAAHLADAMDLDREQVSDAIGNNHYLFGNYGPIPAAELAALSAAVWTSVTGHAYPDDWAQGWAARIADELAAAV
jgi:hypothetical protein